MSVHARGISLGNRLEGEEMNSNVASKDIDFEDYTLTQHALQRMGTRGLSSSEVSLVLAYGRQVHTRGAMIYVVGRKEISRCAAFGIDLSELDGLQVICSTGGTILTVYRNRDFRGLRPRRRGYH
jgi:hypothetical protein